MELTDNDRALIAAIQHGLPLSPRPYADVGAKIGMSEQEVIARIDALISGGVIKRFGVVVNHQECGYRANALVVWRVPEEKTAEIGKRFTQFPFVTLCYRRAKRLPEWPYNLYTMIHARDRAEALGNLARLIAEPGAWHLPYQILFSRRRFKQGGAQYMIPRAEIVPFPRARVRKVSSFAK